MLSNTDILERNLNSYFLQQKRQSQKNTTSNSLKLQHKQQTKTLSKNNLYKISGIILFLVFVSACDNGENLGKADVLIVSKELIKSSKSIIIPIDSLTENRSRQLANSEDSKDWFLNFNMKTNEIQMHVLKDKSLHKRLNFPNGVGRVFHSTFIS